MGGHSPHIRCDLIWFITYRFLTVTILYLAVGGHSPHIRRDLVYYLPFPRRYYITCGCGWSFSLIPTLSSQAAIQKRGRNLGCCLSDQDTRCGGLSSFTTHVSCDTIDSCVTETVGTIVADFRLSNVCQLASSGAFHRIVLSVRLMFWQV